MAVYNYLVCCSYNYSTHCSADYKKKKGGKRTIKYFEENIDYYIKPV